jgi:hypothetical protein
MDKEDLKNLARSEQFISGVHNYCDRWCERCPLTARCLNFAFGEEQFSDPETKDISNSKFWQKLAETLHMTLDMINEMAEEQGIVLDPDNAEELEEEHQLDEEVIENQLCCRTARAYAEMVEDWFEAAEDFFDQKEEPYSTNERVTMPESGVFGGSADLEDAFQVVRWYQHQIYVKLMRAVRGSLEERTELPDEFQKDSDGSAKVALIGIDRSIAAWGQIKGHLPMWEKAVGQILVHLERLCRQVEKAFPSARSFIRPGFDRIELNS